MQTDRLISTKTIVPAYLVGATLYLISLRYSPLLQAFLKAVPIALLLGSLALQRNKKLSITIWALTFCFLGDIAGEAKSLFADKAFIVQIALFTVAQVLYTISFARHRLPASKDPKVWKIAAQVGFVTLAVAMAFLLFNSIQSPAFRIAIAVYLLILLTMALFAVAQNRSNCGLYALGAFFFVISDCLIAIYAFVVQFPHRHFLVMITYFAAQLLINLDLIKREKK